MKCSSEASENVGGGSCLAVRLSVQSVDAQNSQSMPAAAKLDVEAANVLKLWEVTEHGLARNRALRFVARALSACPWRHTVLPATNSV